MTPHTLAGIDYILYTLTIHASNGAVDRVFAIKSDFLHPQPHIPVILISAPSIPPSRTSTTSRPPPTRTSYVCCGTNIRPLLLKRSTPSTFHPFDLLGSTSHCLEGRPLLSEVVLHCPCDPPLSQRIHSPGVTRSQPRSKRLVPRSTYRTYQCPPTYIHHPVPLRP